MSSNMSKMISKFSANRFAAILLSTILLTWVAAMGMVPAEAIRSEGRHNLETNSDLVCGVEICSTPMTIQEKIDAFRHETIPAPTIIQQSAQQFAPQALLKDAGSFKKLLKSDIKQMIGSKIQAAKDIKQFSKLDLKKINKDKFSATSLKQFKSLKSSFADKKLLKSFSDLSAQKIKIKKTLDARKSIDVKSPLAKQKLDIGDKPQLIRDALTPKQTQKDIAKTIKFKGEQNKIPMKIVKELKLKVPKIKK